MSRLTNQLIHSIATWRHYFGGWRPGELSHALRREPVSACLARRINRSRSVP
jgi:hypothetical protein